jgi:hypothetical protein
MTPQQDLPTEPPFLRWTPPLTDAAGNQAQALRLRLDQGRRLRQSAGDFLLLDGRHQWDLAIVLDACRYDVFAGANWLPGRLEKKVSPGSSTEEWLAASLEGRFDDVVYVSASPYVSRVYLQQVGLGQPFAHLEEVWKYGWDETLHTVPPQAVSAAYLRLRPAWPEGKFVLHFMQPHHPFIGPTRLEQEGWRQYWGALETDLAELDGKAVYQLLEEGRIDRAAVWQAYLDNLRLVLAHIQDLQGALPARVVITADHGDCFGEYGVFGHPSGLALPELIEVPFFLLDKAGGPEGQTKRH